MKKHVGITRDFRPDGALEAFCRSESITLSHHNFLNIDYLPVQVPERAGIVFFASSNAVKSFFAFNDKSHLPLACYGPGTAKTLNSLGHEAAFIGKSSEPLEVANELAAYTGNRVVFFPVSSLSSLNISRVLPENQVEIRTSYRVNISPRSLDPVPDIMIFTSPSNVTGYTHGKNPLDVHALAIGSTTLEHQKKLGFTNNLKASQPSDNGLIEGLEKLL